MSPDDIAPLFAGPDGSYRFARWDRPIAPVVFGVEDTTLVTLRRALEAVTELAGHPLAETDPDQGANLLIFFFRDWSELLAVPDLGRLVEGLPALVARLEAEGANQYRHFRFEADGAIRACIAFLRMDKDLAALPAETIALSLAAQTILLWSDAAFRTRSPLARSGATLVLRPEIAAVIRAAYDPGLPSSGTDRSHALRLAARITRAAGAEGPRARPASTS